MNKTIAFDLSSGDKGSTVAFKAAVDFSLLNKDWKVIAFVKEDIDTSGKPSNVEIRKCTEVITMEDGPLEVRRKKDATLIRAIESVSNKESSAVVSAAASGPLVTAGYLTFKSIEGLKPAFAPVAKRISGKPLIALDIGANVGADAQQLNQYAEMGTALSRVLGLSKEPVVKLLNIGEEDKKGTQLQLDAFELLKENKNINFKGNIESSQMLIDEEYDVIVGDAYSGNIALKAIEGTLESVKTIIKSSMEKSFMTKMGIGLAKGFRKDLRAFVKGLSGGAVVLGLNEILIKSHGNSDAVELQESLETAKTLVEKDLIKSLKEVL